MKLKSAETFPITIYVGGDPKDAERICRQYCMEVGFCVTVTPTEYIYKGGQESGVIVGIINYPRFPREPQELIKHAMALTGKLMDGLFQESATVETPVCTQWISKRDSEQSPSSQA